MMVTEPIKHQAKAAVAEAEEEIAQLSRQNTELELLSH